MNTSIEELIIIMKKLAEDANGNLSGGYLSLLQNINSNNPAPLNSKNCINAETRNLGPCTNDYCNGSANSGRCLNTMRCLMTHDDGGCYR